MLALFSKIVRRFRSHGERALKLSEEPCHILGPMGEPYCRQKSKVTRHGGPLTATCKTCLIIAWQHGWQDSLTPEAARQFENRVLPLLHSANEHKAQPVETAEESAKDKKQIARPSKPSGESEEIRDLRSILDLTLSLREIFAELRESRPDSDILKAPALSRSWIELPPAASDQEKLGRFADDSAHQAFVNYRKALRILISRYRIKTWGEGFPIFHPAIHGQHIFEALDFQEEWLKQRIWSCELSLPEK